MCMYKRKEGKERKRKEKKKNPILYLYSLIWYMFYTYTLAFQNIFLNNFQKTLWATHGTLMRWTCFQILASASAPLSSIWASRSKHQRVSIWKGAITGASVKREAETIFMQSMMIQYPCSFHPFHCLTEPVTQRSDFLASVGMESPSKCSTTLPLSAATHTSCPSMSVRHAARGFETIFTSEATCTAACRW